MRPAVKMADDSTLAEQVSLLTGEVKVLRESVDELKTALEWALRNARITVQFDEAANMPPDRVAEPDTGPIIELFEIGDGVNFEKGGVDYNEHHLIPRHCHRKNWWKRHFTKDEMQQTILVCKMCHNSVHELIPDEKELGRDYYTIEKLRSHPAIAKYLDWKRRRVN